MRRLVLALALGAILLVFVVGVVLGEILTGTERLGLDPESLRMLANPPSP